MDNSFTINGREIKFEIKKIDIYKLDYYYDNPRINYIISQYPPDKVNSELIEKALMNLDYPKELRQDIERNGGLTDEVLVLGNQVIEGNTRLCCYRKLHNVTKDDKWRFIPAKIIIDQIEPQELFLLLSNYHIKGKNPWSAYEKAACICKMLEKGYRIEEVAREVGSTVPKVETIQKAYQTMRDKYLTRQEISSLDPLESQKELTKYSYFETFYSNKDLLKRAETTPQFVDEFIEWVAEERIPKAQNVRQLHLILNNKKAQKKFLESDNETAFEDSYAILYWERPDKVDGFYKKIADFRDLISSANVQEVKQDVASNPQCKTTLVRCLKDLQRFLKEIGLQQ